MTSREWVNLRLASFTLKTASPALVKLSDEVASVCAGFIYNEHGTVQDLGKFEGEYIACVWFYDMFLNGDGEYIDDDEQRFEVSEVEKQLFDFDKPRYRLRFSNDGFVIGGNII
jgi:hypothetical protein